MTYEEFEWHILQFMYEDGIDRFRAPDLAFSLGLPVETIQIFLKQAAGNRVLAFHFADDGTPEFFIPTDRIVEVSMDESLDSLSDTFEPEDDGVDGTLGNAASKRKIPMSLHQYLVGKYGEEFHRNAYSSTSQTQHVAHTAPKLLDNIESETLLPVVADRSFVELDSAAFSNPSRTMFKRTIRVYGDFSSNEIRTRVERVFQSFGYRKLREDHDGIRFERGSVFFLIALIPLFVLIVPMIVYLILSIIGRSTIEKEPLLLDVTFEKKEHIQMFWEIDLTFLGLHGVVLGAADQSVLNREIDALKTELQYVH